MAFGILQWMRAARITGTGLTGALLLLTSGCGMFQSAPPPQNTASEFLKAFSAGDNARAAQLTDNPAAAKKMLDATRKGMHPESLSANLGQVKQVKDGQSASFNADWEFGGNRRWTYSGTLPLHQGKDQQGQSRWLVHWSPSVVNPQLKPGQTLARDDQKAPAQPVLDAAGKPLMQPEPLHTITLDPQGAGDLNHTAGALAGALNKIDPSITQQSIVNGAKKNPSQPYKVVQLRDSDYKQVQAQIHGLPGLSFDDDQGLVAPNKDFASQVLPGVRKIADSRREAGSGWHVHAVNADGTDGKSFVGDPPKPEQPVQTTLNSQVQQAAEGALKPVPQPAMIVAMRPSNGDIVSVAQNEAANQKGPLALTGQYPPGSTFKIATASAGLVAGKIHADQPVACPPVLQFNGLPLPNDKNEDLKTVPERTAFAQSCNTTHGQLAADLPADALPNQAKQMGIGADYNIPGITTITGKVPTPQGDAAKAHTGIGQGKVLASPFGMTMAAATVANGKTPTPNLVQGAPTKSNTPPSQLPPQVSDQMKQMMRAVVTEGTARSLGDLGDVYGKTGTAQFGPDGSHTHGWFVGFRGDMAFAVLVTDAGANKPAIDAAHQFLQQAPKL